MRKNSIFSTAILVSLFSFLSKILGFVRQMVIAACFGASWRMDAFFFAQKIPQMIFPSLGTSFSTAFITLYISKRISISEKDGERFASSVLIGGLGLSLVLSFATILIAPWLVRILAPGFYGNQLSLAVHLTRLVLSAFVFTMLQYLFAAILNSKRIFVRAQVAGLFYNISIIIITVLLGKNQSMDALTWTVIVGQFIQVLVLFVFVKRDFCFSLDFSRIFTDTKGVVIVAIPILFSHGLESLNQIVDELLGSTLREGTISALSYSSSLNTIVTGVFIASLSTVLYPTLTENAANNRMIEFNDELKKSISLIVVSLIPISVIASNCSFDIVDFVYQRGNFDQSATQLTTAALMYYSWMYPFLALQNVFIRAFYAMQDTKAPLFYSAGAVVLNAALSFILSKRMDIGGLALGTTLSTMAAAFCLFVGIRKRLPQLDLHSCYLNSAKAIIAGLVMALCVVGLSKCIVDIPALGKLVIITFVSGSIYIVCLMIMRCEVIYLIFKKIFSRIKT